MLVRMCRGSNSKISIRKISGTFPCVCCICNFFEKFPIISKKFLAFLQFSSSQFSGEDASLVKRSGLLYSALTPYDDQYCQPLRQACQITFCRAVITRCTRTLIIHIYLYSSIGLLVLQSWLRLVYKSLLSTLAVSLD